MKRQFKGMKNAPWKRARYSFTEILCSPAFACMMIFVTVAMQFVVSAAKKDRKIIEDRMQAEQ